MTVHKGGFFMPEELMLLIQTGRLPCCKEAAQIIENELKKGNTIESFGNVGSLPDETYYVVFFSESPKGNYSNTLTRTRKGGEYKVICLSGSGGAIEILFRL